MPSAFSHSLSTTEPLPAEKHTSRMHFLLRRNIKEKKHWLNVIPFMHINEHLVIPSIIYDGPHYCVYVSFKSDTVFLSNLLRIQVQPHYLHRILSYWNAQSAPSLRYFTQSPNTHYPFVKFLKDHVCRVYMAFTKLFFSWESVISTHYSCGVCANI